MARKMLMEYEGEWDIDVLNNPTVFKNSESPAFSPLPDNSVSFQFESWCQVVEVKPPIYLFKLKLVKVSSVDVTPTLEVFIIVKLYYNVNGKVFKEYKPISAVVDNMKVITFEDVTGRQLSDKLCAYYTTDYMLLRDCKKLRIKCKLIFYDQIDSAHLTPAIEKVYSNKSPDLMNNFKLNVDPNLFSDFAFKVGSETFPAHKIILATHSPVLKNMLTHELSESKTNSATITDATTEIFGMFLKYLYSGEFQVDSWNMLTKLYYLADKYDVEVFKNECTDAAISYLSTDLFCEIIELAYFYNNDRLKAAAITYAVKHIKKIVAREDWKALVDANVQIGYDVAVNFIPK